MPMSVAAFWLADAIGFSAFAGRAASSRASALLSMCSSLYCS